MFSVNHTDRSYFYEKNSNVFAMKQGSNLKSILYNMSIYDLGAVS